MGEKPEQLHPTEPLQCLPCTLVLVQMSLWLWLNAAALGALANAATDNVIVANAMKPKIAFFIFLHTDSCRAQLLNVINNENCFSYL